MKEKQKILATSFLPFPTMFPTSIQKTPSNKGNYIYLPNAKILGPSKLIAFANKNSNVALMIQLVTNMVENTVGKGDNTGNVYFLLIPPCFLKAISS